MDKRSSKDSAAAHATPGRAHWRVAVAVALLAVPLVGVLLNTPPRDESLAQVGLLADAPGIAAPESTVLADRPASATPDLALLDARDVRRALPAPQRAVAGLDTTTL